ncbi:hypothetical protein VPNG_07621 [Cytospora leucostoma]|uniref:Cytochrome P450 monooxygenase n=1 Tax=Cytospora leucostoma TaxID=1230097 RepID=A0A423WDH5_9PEZI|nr:hypothetical protein VPNG_07621 [Cytospora leucostoma]
MAAPSRLNISWDGVDHSLPAILPALPLLSDLAVSIVPYAIAAILILAVIISFHARSSSTNGHKKIPTLNPKRLFELTDDRTRREYDMHSWDLLHKGNEEYPDQPFRVLSSELRDITVLPPRYVNEIKNDHRFNFNAILTTAFHDKLPGFRAMMVFDQPNRIMQVLTQQDINRAIPTLTRPLSREADAALRDSITDSTVWHDMVAKDLILNLIARLSTLVFMGGDMCHDKDWIDISVNHAVKLVLARNDLNTWPMWLRPLANVYLPRCRALRDLEARARDIIDAQLEKRKRSRAEAELKGVKLEVNDALEWYQEQYMRLGGEFDPTAAQLGMSFVAIHTTADLLTQVVLDLAEHQELMQPLREEVTDCLSRRGEISKIALHDMILLDSVIKESQRLKPVQVGAMSRKVMEDATLSDGVHVKRGSTTVIFPRDRDATLYENPEEYDGYRFYRLRQQPGKRNTAQVVTTSPDHIAFGHGKYACPGRWFAVHEVKLALCHLLLKYDWKIAEGAERPQWHARGNNIDCDSLAKIAIRRREGAEAEALML